MLKISYILILTYDKKRYKITIVFICFKWGSVDCPLFVLNKDLLSLSTQVYNYAINKEKKMKVVLLAGGFGTRISEESHLRPKPMIDIGGKPILWHIMKEYSYYGYNDFIICAGYKQHFIKEWFAD